MPIAPKKQTALSTQATLADDDTVTGIDTSAATPAAKNVNFTLSAIATWVLAKVATVTQEQAEAISSPETTNRWWTVQRVAQCAAAVVAANASGLTNQWSGTRAPLGTDDGTTEGGGFAQGSLWRWNLRVWICVANTTNVASWVELTAAPSLTNPMTTAGDLIIGGTGGTPARLAAGTNGHVLTMVTGSPAYAALPAGTPPYPLGSASPRTTTGDIVNGSANNGQLYRVDTTSGDVDLSLRLQSVRAYESNFYFFALKIASANASQIVPESGVNINGVNSPVTLTHNLPVRLWRGAENEWFTF